MSRHVTRMFCAVAAGLALTASGLTGRTAPSAITCCSLSGVAVTSAGNAWAV